MSLDEILHKLLTLKMRVRKLTAQCEQGPVKEVLQDIEEHVELRMEDLLNEIGAETEVLDR